MKNWMVALGRLLDIQKQIMVALGNAPIIKMAGILYRKFMIDNKYSLLTFLRVL